MISWAWVKWCAPWVRSTLALVLSGAAVAVWLDHPITNVLLHTEVVAAPPTSNSPAVNQALTLRSDVQEANAKTGVITARGNVQIFYPARQIQATAAQAQYFSKERRIVLSGNVYVLQEGNSMRGETITYLIDEGRFVALPLAPKQVESIYIVPEAKPLATNQPAAPVPPAPFTPGSEFSPPSAPASPTQP
ncbi:MAG TPA: LptA/OstA family protein [Coleofasciculaceae cyanobacterium]